MCTLVCSVHGLYSILLSTFRLTVSSIWLREKLNLSVIIPEPLIKAEFEAYFFKLGLFCVSKFSFL